MAIKLKVRQPESVKLKVNGDSTVSLKLGEAIIGVMPDPYEGSYTVTPSEDEQTLLTEGKSMSGDVTVHAIPSDYVGSAIERRDSDDLIVTGNLVNVPGGFYEENAGKAIPEGSVAVPNVSIEAHPVITTDGNGLISVSVSESESVSPSVTNGYVTAEQGHAGTITFAGTASSQLSTQGATTITPSESQQTAVPQGKFTTGNVVVDPIPPQYIVPSGTVSITSNGSTDVTAYATASVNVQPDLETVSKSYTPSTSAQSETITPSAGKDGIAQVDVSVAAMPTGNRGNSTVYVSQTASEMKYAVKHDNATAGYYTANQLKDDGTVILTKETATVTPSAADQTVAPSGSTKYLSSVTVEGDPNLTQMNILGGASIFGVNGYPLNKNTSVPFGEEAGSAAIRNGKKAWVNGNLVTGTMTEKAAATYTPTTSTQTIAAGQYLAGAQTIDPIPPQYIIPTGTKSITANGTGIDVTSYASVDVAVPGSSPNLQNKTKSYTPSETTQSETVSADAGYDGLGTVDVSVDAISSTYVGSGITRRDSTDLSASGATVSVPSGYYESNESKAIASGTAKPPTTISGSQATLSTGTNTITLQKTLNVTPQVSPGYIASGTQDSVLVSLNASVPTQAAQTLYPSSSDQTIQSGRYLTGNQTIKAVAVSSNLTADNIKNGVTVTVGDSADPDRILSVTGTYTGGGGGSVQFDTKTTTASDYPKSISFSSMKGEPEAFVVRLNAQVQSSGSTTYYYIVDVSAFGTTTHGNCFRIGSTRRVDNITSGYSWSYSGSTLTITSSASSRSASPGAFYNGSYELLYCY